MLRRKWSLREGPVDQKVGRIGLMAMILIGRGMACPVGVQVRNQSWVCGLHGGRKRGVSPVVTGQKVPVEKSLVGVITLVQGYALMIEFVLNATDRSGTRVQIRQIPWEKTHRKIVSRKLIKVFEAEFVDQVGNVHIRLKINTPNPSPSLVTGDLSRCVGITDHISGALRIGFKLACLNCTRESKGERGTPNRIAESNAACDSISKFWSS